MRHIVWGAPNARIFAQGVDRGVFYPKSGVGVPWPGLLGINEGSDDNNSSETYLEGVKTRNQKDVGSFNAAIKCFTYPEALEQNRRFDFSYRTHYGSYQIHLVYNALATPTENQFQTLRGSVDPSTFEWKISTLPLVFQEEWRVSHFIVDTSIAYSWVVEAVEDILYGADGDPRMPTPDELFQLYQDGALLTVTNHPDGTIEIEGPPEAVHWLDDTTFEIIWPSVKWIDDTTFSISSL